MLPLLLCEEELVRVRLSTVPAEYIHICEGAKGNDAASVSEPRGRAPYSRHHVGPRLPDRAPEIILQHVGIDLMNDFPGRFLIFRYPASQSDQHSLIGEYLVGEPLVDLANPPGPRTFSIGHTLRPVLQSFGAAQIPAHPLGIFRRPYDQNSGIC